MPFTYTGIQTDHHLTELIYTLAKVPGQTVAIDFEADYNLHAYGEKLCLIQLYDGEELYLIDPLAISDKILVNLFSMKNIIFMFYSADSDRSLVFKNYGVKMLSVYDLQLLVEVLDLPGKGLDAVLESQLGIIVEDKKTYQRHDWRIRPIAEDAKQYALNDVAHLFDLHKTLLESITAANLTEKLVLKLASSVKDFDKKSVPGVFKTSSFKQMNKKDQAVFHQIFQIREEFAKQLDVPSHLVIPKHDLANLAANPRKIRSFKFGDKVPKAMRVQIVERILAIDNI